MDISKLLLLEDDPVNFFKEFNSRPELRQQILTTCPYLSPEDKMFLKNWDTSTSFDEDFDGSDFVDSQSLSSSKKSGSDDEEEEEEDEDAGDLGDFVVDDDNGSDEWVKYRQGDSWKKMMERLEEGDEGLKQLLTGDNVSNCLVNKCSQEKPLCRVKTGKCVRFKLTKEKLIEKAGRKYIVTTLSQENKLSKKSKSKPKSIPKPASKPKSIPKPASKPASKPKSKPKSIPKPKSKPKSIPKPASKPKSKPKSIPKPKRRIVLT